MPSKTLPFSLIVHPTVLLGVLDHYKRITESGGNARVVGVLLGSRITTNGGEAVSIRTTNCFAIPFEEDAKDDGIWFLDHNYMETMAGLFKKINSKETIVGWYHSGPELRQSDLAINEVFQRYCANPVLAVVPTQENASFQVPTNAYIAVEEAADESGRKVKKFAHIPSIVEAEIAEDIGVEHLLRDTKDISVGDLTSKISEKHVALSEMLNQLDQIHAYLQKVAQSKLPVNNQIVFNLQKIQNLMLDENGFTAVLNALVQTNSDAKLMVYVSSVCRMIISMHALIDNKISQK